MHLQTSLTKFRSPCSSWGAVLRLCEDGHPQLCNFITSCRLPSLHYDNKKDTEELIFFQRMYKEWQFGLLWVKLKETVAQNTLSVNGQTCTIMPTPAQLQHGLWLCHSFADNRYIWRHNNVLSFIFSCLDTTKFNYYVPCCSSRTWELQPCQKSSRSPTSSLTSS